MDGLETTELLITPLCTLVSGPKINSEFQARYSYSLSNASQNHLNFLMQFSCVIILNKILQKA